jgi:hypothetical protein
MVLKKPKESVGKKNFKKLATNGDALTHRREVCFFTPKNKIAKKQIALSAMLNLGLFLPYN